MVCDMQILSTAEMFTLFGMQSLHRGKYERTKKNVIFFIKKKQHFRDIISLQIHRFFVFVILIFFFTLFLSHRHSIIIVVSIFNCILHALRP